MEATYHMGCAANISGQYYNAVTYKLNEKTEALDYDAIEQQAAACKPKRDHSRLLSVFLDN